MGCVCPRSSAPPSYADYQDEEPATEVRLPPTPPPDVEELPAESPPEPPENEFFNEIQRSARPWELVSEFATKLQSVQQAEDEGIASTSTVQMVAATQSSEPRAPPRASVLEKIKPVVVPK